MDDPHNKSTFSVEVIHFSQHPSQGVNKRKKEEEKKRLRLTKTIPKHAETSAAWKEEWELEPCKDSYVGIVPHRPFLSFKLVLMEDGQTPLKEEEVQYSF